MAPRDAASAIYHNLIGFRAAADLVIATETDIDLCETLCFHAQQASEKAVKAVLIDRGVQFPYTHNMARLITIVRELSRSATSSFGVGRILQPTSLCS